MTRLDQALAQDQNHHASNPVNMAMSFRRQRANHDGSTSMVRLSDLPPSELAGGDEMDYYLTSLAKIMDAVNDEVLSILEADLQQETELAVSKYGGNSSAAADTLKGKKNSIVAFRNIFLGAPVSDEEKESAGTMISRLRDTRCTGYWTTAWGACKDGIFITKLENITNFWADAVPIFREISPRLQVDKELPRDLHQSIRMKIQTLELAVGKLLELSPGLGLEIPRDGHVSQSLKLKAARAAEIHQERIMQSPQNFSQLIRDQSILSAIVPVAVFGSSAFSIVAWGFSSHENGRTDDPDFWLLLQSIIMASLSSFTTLYPLWRRSWGAPLRLSLVLSSLALACNLFAILFYFMFSKTWSSILGFFGSALQAFVTLQLSLLAMKPAVNQKQD